MASRLLRISPIFFFILVGGLIVYLSEKLDVVTAQNMGGVLGPAAYPRLLGVLMLILSFLFIYKGWSEENDASADHQRETQAKPSYHLAFLSFTGLLVLTYFLETLGFIIISILLMMWFMFMMGERRWRFLILSSLIFPCVVYSIFRYGFDIVLPEGILAIFSS